MSMLRKLTCKYNVTVVFTLLSMLNLMASWGNFKYRLVMVFLNVVCGFSMEYLVNRFAFKKINFYKGFVGFILLIINVLWIFVAWN